MLGEAETFRQVWLRHYGTFMSIILKLDQRPSLKKKITDDRQRMTTINSTLSLWLRRANTMQNFRRIKHF